LKLYCHYNISQIWHYYIKASINILSAPPDRHSPTPSVEEIVSPATIHDGQSVAGGKPKFICRQWREEHLSDVQGYGIADMEQHSYPSPTSGGPPMETGEPEAMGFEDRMELLCESWTM
jgi:hypothetical protein